MLRDALRARVARAGDTMAVEIDGIGRLENSVQRESAPVQEAA